MEDTRLYARNYFNRMGNGGDRSNELVQSLPDSVFEELGKTAPEDHLQHGEIIEAGLNEAKASVEDAEPTGD